MMTNDTTKHTNTSTWKEFCRQMKAAAEIMPSDRDDLEHSGVALHAQPYSISAAGFYFNCLGDYQHLSARNFDTSSLQLVEEYEIQFIDGSSEAEQLFRMMDVDQCNLAAYYELLEIFEALDETEQAAVDFLVSNIGRDLREVLEDAVYSDLMISDEDADDLAREFLADTGGLDGLPSHLEFYFDFELYANDLLRGGDWDEWEYNGTDYVIMNAGDF